MHFHFTLYVFLTLSPAAIRMLHGLSVAVVLVVVSRVAVARSPTTAMQHLKSVFRDVAGLHARIDLVAANSSVIRIALIPAGRRQAVAPVLNALVDDPIEKTPWAAALADRPLAKDTLVQQSAIFDHVGTHNSLVVYPIPFKGPAVEYLEVSSVADSWDHLKTCHLHVFLTNGEPPAAKTAFPNLVVVDAPSVGPVPAAPPLTNVNYEGESIPIDSSKALQANEELQRSPQNASHYTELVNASRIAFLRAQLTERPGAVYAALRQSIIASCEQQIAELPLADAVNATPRIQWSQTAHHELQSGLLPAVRGALTHSLAWWKLYARSDDVESELSSLIIDKGLAQSRAAFSYAEGQLGTPEPDFVVQTGLPMEAAAPAITWLHNAAYTSVLSALVIQVPLVVLAVVGVLSDGFTWYQMGALALLGIVAGLRKLQTSWLRASAQFEEVLSDVLLSVIGRGEQQLFALGEKSVLEKSQQRGTMERALSAIKAGDKGP